MTLSSQVIESPVNPGWFKAIFIACADNIFGPYTEQKEPILTQQGKPWEVDEIIAPALTYDRSSQQPVLFYTGADHSKGWWIMSAIPSKNGDVGNDNNNEAKIFSLAEQKFANLFSPANPIDQTAEGFLFRFYPTTNTYIGITAGEVFVLGTPFGPDVLNVGKVPSILELLENR